MLTSCAQKGEAIPHLGAGGCKERCVCVWRGVRVGGRQLWGSHTPSPLDTHAPPPPHKNPSPSLHTPPRPSLTRSLDLLLLQAALQHVCLPFQQIHYVGQPAPTQAVLRAQGRAGAGWSGGWAAGHSR